MRRMRALSWCAKLLLMMGGSSSSMRLRKRCRSSSVIFAILSGSLRASLKGFLVRFGLLKPSKPSRHHGLEVVLSPQVRRETNDLPQSSSAARGYSSY